MIGRTIGNYVVQRQVGQGGMGIVYLAEHPRIHKKVAIKVLLPEYSSDQVVVQRFFNEAKAANEIHNEHIIDIIDFGELPEGSSYIIMEWLDGVSLADVLGEDVKLPLPRALHIARGIGRALAAAHLHGIVHRDLKPDNIFLLKREDDTEFVKVLDFGIAKLMKNDPATEVKTQTGALIGTPSFMAPEQCRGLPIDARTDIYALGCIVYRMVTGQLPFAAQALGELLLQHMTQPPRPPREIDPEIPEMVERAVLRALEKEPDRRFTKVEEMLAQLGGAYTGGFPAIEETQRTHGKTANVPGRQTHPSMDTIGAASGQAIQPTLPGPPRSSSRALLIGGGLAAVVGFGATAFVLTRKQTEAPKPPVNAPAAQPPVTTPPVQPPPTAPPPAVVPPPPAPSTAKVTIRTLPANATVLLDGAKLDNPFSGSFPLSDARHRLEVKAPGHRTETQWIVFDQDRALEVPLQKGSGSHEQPVVKGKLPSPPRVEDKPPPSTAPVITRKPDEKKPDEKKPDDKRPDEKPVYKGTKGKLITEFPE